MAKLHNHYEAAFEDFVRSRGWPYLPIDEKRKAIFSGARIKSFDFLVYPPGDNTWLVDVKGRKFPYIGAKTKRYWENWVTQADIDGLRRWKGAFGTGFEPMIMFVYWLLGPPERDPTLDVHVYRDRYYAFMAVRAGDYERLARTRSPKWETVSVPVRDFRNLVRPLAAV